MGATKSYGANTSYVPTYHCHVTTRVPSEFPHKWVLCFFSFPLLQLQRKLLISVTTGLEKNELFFFFGFILFYFIFFIVVGFVIH